MARDWDALGWRGERPLPFETLRHWYVTLFGGRSEELAWYEVGVNLDALKANTDLVSGQDTVTISVLGAGQPHPLFAQRRFLVVGLDRRKPEALRHSPGGEAVLPADSFEYLRRPALEPRRGQAVVLNGVLSKVLGPAAGRWPEELLRRRRSPQGPA